MNDQQWNAFFRVCADVLRVEKHSAPIGPRENGSWCAWTTFDSLQDSLTYLRAPLPTKEEIHDTYVGHGANWSQFFHYRELCHFLVPRTFFWERASVGKYESGDGAQDVDALSRRLTVMDIPHRLTPLVLEIKLY